MKGWSTEEEDEENEQNYENQKEEILNQVNHIFDDVDAEFSTTSQLKARLEIWKRSYPKAYR
jgi:F0F1-type ATP synthase membrane subunit b/b'